MKRNKYCPIGIFLLFFTMRLQAQEIKKISLQEAVTLGLQHSRYLQMDKAKIEEAHAVLLGAKNNQLPDFNWSASYLRLTNAKVDMKMKTGNANSNSEPAPSINQAMIGMASLSLPLYAGHRIKYDIARAKLGIKAAE
ncbi:MAG TPA: TolC family protein, partial [Ferruginibacter sp.]|nr:TolC family protein [Ferruginibacter sp.]